MMNFAFHLIETDDIILIERFIDTEECCERYPNREGVDEIPAVKYMVKGADRIIYATGRFRFLQRLVNDTQFRGEPILNSNSCGGWEKHRRFTIAAFAGVL
jgi:hypothetical protein